MRIRNTRARRTINNLIKLISLVSAVAGIAVLFWILADVFVKGAGAINWQFFTEPPPPPGAGTGGLGNAIIGTLLMIIFATLTSVPAGVFAGVYLVEVNPHSKLSEWIRFLTNTMMGIPSIVTGLFVYAVLVKPMGTFSGYAGGVALALIMFPVITRTTEDVLKLVPDSVRESALALGAKRWKATFSVVFRTASSGLITGSLLAVARVSGETAPLLFTALNSPYWPESLAQPTANLTVTIFNFAMSPYPEWQKLAWGASLLITTGVLLVILLVRTALSRGGNK